MTPRFASGSRASAAGSGAGPGGARGAGGDAGPGSECIAPLPDVVQALVLSGGGALGAYEVGVAKALVTGASPVSDYRPLHFGAYSGTSVGAYNASFIGSRPEGCRGAVELLDTVWRERIANTPTSCGNGVFRIRGAPFQFLDPGCLLHPIQNALALARDAGPLSSAFLTQGARFLTSDETIQVRALQTIDVSAFISVAPLDALVADTIDFAALAAASARISVVASNWKSGDPEVFDNRGTSRPVGRQEVLASMALPGLFPPIFLDGVPFVDGGVTMNTPLKPVIAGGADVVHVVYSDPLIEDVPFPRLPTTLDSVYRLYLILVADRVNVDLGTAAAVNALITGEGGAAARTLVARLPGRGERAMPRAESPPRDGEPYRPIEIHKYRPRQAASSAAGLIDFSLDQIEWNIERGFENARDHDCETEGCILIDPVVWNALHPPHERTEQRR